MIHTENRTLKALDLRIGASFLFPAFKNFVGNQRAPGAARQPRLPPGVDDGGRQTEERREQRRNDTKREREQYAAPFLFAHLQ